METNLKQLEVLEQLNLPQEVPWQDKEAKRNLEAQLRDLGLVATVNKDGSYEIMPLADFIPEHVFTTKWNAAPAAMPDGTVYKDPVPIDFGLVPNAKERLDLKHVEIMPGVKYAIEGETAIMGIVTEDGFQLTHVGEYQDLSDRDVSPAGKTWGTGKVAGVSPLWIKIDDWKDLEGAVVNARIEGIPLAKGDGEEDPISVSIPAVIDRESRHWGKDFEEKLRAHEVYKDLHLPVGTRIIWTTSLLYWEQDYDVRYFNSDKTPTINMSSTLTLPDGREVESLMVAHTAEPRNIELNLPQTVARTEWLMRHPLEDVPIRANDVSEEIRAAFVKARDMQMAPGKLKNLVTEEAFSVGPNPNPEDIKLLLVESFSELRMRYDTLKNLMWHYGAGIDLTLIRNGDSTAQRNGELPGVILVGDDLAIDDTIAKRSVQRSYDVGGSVFWNTPAPDMVFSSERTSALATVEVALQTAGEPFPREEILRDWRLNERSFGIGTGKKASEFSDDELLSFEKAIEGGENFSFVTLKTLTFLVDLMQTANTFYETFGRHMRVAVAVHEGNMQIMKAILNNANTKEGLFDPIESTQVMKFDLDVPFEWPSFTDETEICKGINGGNCDDIVLEAARTATDDTLGDAAALMIIKTVIRENHLSRQERNEVDLTAEALTDKIDNRHDWIARRWSELESFVKAVGANRVTHAVGLLTESLKSGIMDHHRSNEGLTIYQELQVLADFARANA